MTDQERYRRAVRAVWERSYHDVEHWNDASREAVQPAMDALLAWLVNATTEAELARRYWEAGDAPGAILRPLLPGVFDAEDLLTLEEACFWVRLRVIAGESGT